MSIFKERERCCEATFLDGEPYWHAYTSGKDTPLLFSLEEDFVFVMNVIAQAAALFPEVRIIAFEVMNNHFHFVVSADEKAVLTFWGFVRKRLVRSFPLMKGLQITIKPIGDLGALRNNIVYTNRNGYVADSSHTPFSYPWGTGRYYFLDRPRGKTLARIFVDDKRRMFRCRTPALPSGWEVSNGYVAPWNYCAVKLGMAMFRDAHNYFMMVSKNVEAYAELAVELDDGEFLTDTELFARLSALLRSDYGVFSIKDLVKPQKIDVARKLRYEFRSSNGQIRRVLGLSQYEIDSIFPLTAAR
mgnify:FL=1